MTFWGDVIGAAVREQRARANAWRKAALQWEEEAMLGRRLEKLVNDLDQRIFELKDEVAEARGEPPGRGRQDWEA